MPSRSPADVQRERKKKNAVAQSQFRQRRANYISSLEETVTKLEAVVLELQDSLRDAKNEANEEKTTLEAILEQLRQEHRAKESEWCAAWQARLPQVPFPGSSQVLPSPSGAHPVTIASRIPSLPSCLDPSLRFGLNLKDRPQLPKHLEDGALNLPARQIPQTVPSLMNLQSSRSPTSTYNAGMSTHQQGLMFRSGDDSQQFMHASSSTIRRGPIAGFELPHMSLFVNTAQSGLPFLPKMSSGFPNPPDLSNSLGHNGRSISPLDHSPHPSPTSASTSASSQIQFMSDLPPNDVENAHGLKSFSTMVAHDPTQVLSSFSLTDPTSGLAHRRSELRRPTFPGNDPYPLPQVHLPPAMTSGSLRSASPTSLSENVTEQYSSQSQAGPSRVRSSTFSQVTSDHGAGANSRHRSNSPPISKTLAVIKAQAFGALRRNRTNKKRSNNHATKVALEALEARGLGLGLEPTTALSLSYQDMEDDGDEDGNHDMSDNEGMEP